MTLEQSTESARLELERETSRKNELEKNIEQAKLNVAQLEARGQRVVALQEYRRMRLELVQGYKALAAIELKLRDLHKRYQALCQASKSTQESQRPKPRPV